MRCNCSKFDTIIRFSTQNSKLRDKLAHITKSLNNSKEIQKQNAEYKMANPEAETHSLMWEFDQSKQQFD